MNATLTSEWVTLDDVRLGMASALLEGAEPGISAGVWRERLECLRESGGGVRARIDPSGYITACFLYEVQVSGEGGRTLLVQRPTSFALAPAQSHDDIVRASEQLAVELRCNRLDLVVNRTRHLRLMSPNEAPVAHFLRDGFSLSCLTLTKSVAGTS